MTVLRDLRHRIVLLKRRVVEEGDGSFTEVWQEGDSVWAKIIPCVGQEVFNEGWHHLTLPAEKFKVTMRFRSSRFARIKWESRVLALLCPPLVDQRRQWMSCLMYGIGGQDE